jgi:hypothetical protein
MSQFNSGRTILPNAVRDCAERQTERLLVKLRAGRDNPDSVKPAARAMHRRTRVLIPAALLAAFALGAQAQGFRFSNDEEAAKAEKARQAERREQVKAQLAVPCLDRIRNQKIMVLFAEDRNGAIAASQAAYGPHFESINKRLRGLGLRTFTQEEIRKQVAQAEIDAHFRNDPDAAIGAAKRLAAQYLLRGVIATRTSRNPVINVNQVSVNLNFTLTAANGKPVSEAVAKNESYSGHDTLGMALTLIDERADEVVAQLYGDYCRNAAAQAAGEVDASRKRSAKRSDK